MKVKQLLKILAGCDLEQEVVFKSRNDDTYGVIDFATKGYIDNFSVFTGWTKKDIKKEFSVAGNLKKCIVLEDVREGRICKHI